MDEGVAQMSGTALTLVDGSGMFHGGGNGRGSFACRPASGVGNALGDGALGGVDDPREGEVGNVRGLLHAAR